MSEFNPHIFLVLRWLLTPDSVSKVELKNNYRSAEYAAAAVGANVYTAAYVLASADAAIYAYIYVNRASADSSFYARSTATTWLSRTKEYIDKYFELTKEDREAYEQRAMHLNILGVNNE